MNDRYLKVYSQNKDASPAYAGMLNLSQVQSLQYYELGTNPAAPLIMVELNGETVGFNIVCTVDNVGDGGTIWPTATAGGEKFIEIISQAQQKNVKGTNPITEVYPPQGVVVTTWAA
jgi:hypothetical protein|tara:strand:+ start:117 stop:467 length:351 start_codon:yes stop_codon:yes gene_type:complete